jgi:hypothetical protein
MKTIQNNSHIIISMLRWANARLAHKTPSAQCKQQAKLFEILAVA